MQSQGLAARCAPRSHLGPGRRPLARQRKSITLCRALGPSDSDSGLTSFGRDDDEEDVGGNKDVQDALAEVLQVQVAMQQAKEEILQDLENRKETVRQIGEEMQEALAKDLELDKLRTELATTCAMSETYEKFNALEDELRTVREQLQAGKREIFEFETRSAAERSKGLFFKNLYQAPVDPSEEDNPDLQEVRAAAARVTDPAQREVSSPLRLYVSSYLTTVLVLVLAQDLSSGSPSLGHDALYGALALFLGYSALVERAALQAARAQMAGSQPISTDGLGQGGSDGDSKAKGNGG